MGTDGQINKILLEIDKIKELGFILQGLYDRINCLDICDTGKQALLDTVNEIRKFLELNSREVKDEKSEGESK